MSISLDNVMALAIDFQEKLVPAMHEKENLIKRSEILLKGLSELDVNIITSQQYTKGLGMTIPQLREILGNEYFDKRAFSCYKDADILHRSSHLRATNLSGSSGSRLCAGACYRLHFIPQAIRYEQCTIANGKDGHTVHYIRVHTFRAYGQRLAPVFQNNFKFD